MFRGNGERWTFDEDRQLLGLLKEGKSRAFISKILGRSIAAVSARMAVLKSFEPVSHQRSRWTPEEDERLAGLVENGASWEEIADEFGRPEGGIKHRWLALQRMRGSSR